jgi:hypothetical protein
MSTRELSTEELRLVAQREAWRQAKAAQRERARADQQRPPTRTPR